MTSSASKEPIALISYLAEFYIYLRVSYGAYTAWWIFNEMIAFYSISNPGLSRYRKKKATRKSYISKVIW